MYVCGGCVCVCEGVHVCVYMWGGGMRGCMCVYVGWVCMWGGGVWGCMCV